MLSISHPIIHSKIMALCNIFQKMQFNQIIKSIIRQLYDIVVHFAYYCFKNTNNFSSNRNILPKPRIQIHAMYYTHNMAFIFLLSSTFRTIP